MTQIRGPRATERKGRTSLHYAADAGDSEAIAQLLINSAVVDATDDDGLTPLHFAAGQMNGLNTADENTIKLLLDAGANVNAQDKDGMSPLHWAMQRRWGVGERKKLVMLLIQAGVDVTLRDHIGQTALHHAAAKGDDQVWTLLDCIPNLDVNKRIEEFGATALHIAAYFGSLNVVKKLIACGAQVDARNHEDETPLEWAMGGNSSEHRSVVEFLENYVASAL
jgi:ankyrin repeat protein